MKSSTLTCYLCKQKFAREDMVSYLSPGTKTPHNYCSHCLAEKQKKEKFNKEICKIFGLQAAGPKIYSQRKNLNDHGISDEQIIETLHYMFDIKGFSKKQESLGLVTEPNISMARDYYYKKQMDALKTARELSEVKITKIPIKIKEDAPKKIKELNPDDFLGDDDDEWY